MRRKGFTLVELLVVIAIIALLMGILMPALAQVRRLAQRMMCGTNLSGLGKAMIVYSNDNDEAFPRAGGRASRWTNQLTNWEAPTQIGAFGQLGQGKATIGSCWYLLVRYAEVTPKQFICKGDLGAKIFKLSDYTIAVPTNVDDLTDVWDFGDHAQSALAPGIHYSYAYHLPFTWTNGTFALNSASNPASPIASDRNPYLDKNAVNYVDGADPDEDEPTWWNSGYYDPDRTGAAAAHQREGQNVLYCDGHTAFEKHPNCGIRNDNIYKFWDKPAVPVPTPKVLQLDLSPETRIKKSIVGQMGTGPKAYEDSYLVNEYNE